MFLPAQTAEFTQGPVGAALEIALVAVQAVELPRGGFVKKSGGELAQGFDDFVLAPGGAEEIVDCLALEEANGREGGQPGSLKLGVLGMGHHRVTIVQQGRKISRGLAGVWRLGADSM